MGAVAEADDHVGVGHSSEKFKVDALGNRLTWPQLGVKPGSHPHNQGVRLLSYDSYPQIVAINDTSQNSDFLLSENYSYDGMGILFLHHSRELDGYEEINTYDQIRSYPAVDEKISVVNRHAAVVVIDHPGRVAAHLSQ